MFPPPQIELCGGYCKAQAARLSLRKWWTSALRLSASRETVSAGNLTSATARLSLARPWLRRPRGPWHRRRFVCLARGALHPLGDLRHRARRPLCGAAGPDDELSRARLRGRKCRRCRRCALLGEDDDPVGLRRQLLAAQCDFLQQIGRVLRAPVPLRQIGRAGLQPGAELRLEGCERFPGCCPRPRALTGLLEISNWLTNPVCIPAGTAFALCRHGICFVTGVS